MKYTLPFLFLLSSLSSFAQDLDRSTRMDNLLQEAGVRTWGRIEYRDATIFCRVPHRTKAIICKLMSGPMGSTYNVYEEFLGAKAQEISDLLKEFNKLPYGKHDRQDLDIFCKNVKGSTVKTCEVQEPRLL